MPPSANAKKAASFFNEPLPLIDFLPINVGLSSATEHTMISILGSPKLPLTTECQTARASDLVKALRVTTKITSAFALTGIKPAVESALAVVTDVCASNPG